MATINQVGVGLSGQSGTGSFVGDQSPIFSTVTLTGPVLGTPVSGSMLNCTGTHWGTQSGTAIQLRFISGTISSAQLLALNATPIQVIAAPGANACIVINNLCAFYNYNSTPYTAGASQIIRLVYGTGTTPSIYTTVFSNAVLAGTANAVSMGIASALTNQDPTQMENTAIYFKNTISTELTSGNSTFNYWIWYTVVDVSDP